MMESRVRVKRALHLVAVGGIIKGLNGPFPGLGGPVLSEYAALDTLGSVARIA